jgi:TatD DNase family protein
MYIDAHAHLDKYASEESLIIHEIESSEIFTVSVSTTPQAYADARAIATQSRWVISTFGIHPWDAPAFHSRMESLQPLIDESPMIGEIGLDYHFIPDPESQGLQREVFRYMVKQGVAQRKILNIHSKGAEADANKILGDLGAVRAILHWYSGPIRVLQALVEKKFYFSVGVEVLFEVSPILPQMEKCSWTLDKQGSLLALQKSPNPERAPRRRSGLTHASHGRVSIGTVHSPGRASCRRVPIP